MTSGKVDLEAAQLVVKKHQLDRKSRIREVVYKRAVFFEFMRQYSSLSLDQIGKMCGKDHSTVLHGIKIARTGDNYDDFRQYKNSLYLDLNNCLMYELKTNCIYTNEAIALVQMERRIEKYL